MLEGDELVRRRAPIVSRCLLAVLVLPWLGCDAPSGAFGACGACERGLECVGIEVAGGFLREDRRVATCTAPCSDDSTCEALAAGAYCSVVDRCVLPCEDDEACPPRAACIGGICGGTWAAGVRISRAIRPVGSALALGARVPFWLEVPCSEAVDLRALTPEILEVTDVIAARSSEACYVEAELRAVGVGRAELVASSEGGEIDRASFVVVRPTRLSVGLVHTLGEGPPGPVDVERVDRSGLVIVVARDAAGERLAIGRGAEWAVDDPGIAAVAPFGSLESDVGIAAVEWRGSGSTALRVRVGDLAHAVQVELP